ncbi:uncharacterized protein LOC133880148 isoform X4 [Alnus glutinosa]|uniref:uncharacterized protein LOC133880148 isoform X4 n=1 Tax=Alnus glutinosa TaxID=3517 RepID=UPI002D7818A3|nr:uncharacterized protein LOC133880148 isoform X4 [Alnus glutinosa]
MAFSFWLCRLRSSKGFSYSKSRSSRSQNHVTPKGRVPRHVFNSNSSRLRHPFLSLIPTALAVSAAALALQCPPNLSANCSPHHEPSEDQYHSDTDVSLFSFNQYHSDTNTAKHVNRSMQNYDNQQHGSPLGGSSFAGSTSALALQYPPNLSSSQYHQPPENLQYHSGTNNYDNQQHGSPLQGSSFAGSTSALALQYPPNLSSSQYHQPPENLQYHSGTNTTKHVNRSMQNYDNQQHGSPLQGSSFAGSTSALALQYPPNLSSSQYHQPPENLQYHSGTNTTKHVNRSMQNYDNQQHGSPLQGSSFAGSTSALALQYPPNLSSSQYHQPSEDQYHSDSNNYYYPQHGSPLRDGWDGDEFPEWIWSFLGGQDTAATPNNEDSNEGEAHKNADKTKRGRRRTSIVWEHFKESFKDGAKRIICNSCHTEFPPSESGSTGHLHLHLKKCGNNEDSKNKQKGDDEDTPSNCSIGTSTRKRSRTKKDDALPRIGTHSIMVERGVSWSDIMDPTYKFIYKIFKKNEWLSLFDHVTVYPRLVQEFYHNMYPINCDSSHFYTKVSGTQLHITSKLINEVTKIPLTSDGNTPFTKFVLPPSNAELKECVHPHFEYEWEKNQNKIPISYLPNQNRLLALIVMQNIWPISCNSYVPLDHAQLIYAIINHISFCLCKHMVMTMIKAHQDNTIALPFGGLITKILQAKLSSIPPTELVMFSEEDFGKALVMKFNDQLQQVHAVDEPAPLAPPAPSASSSSRPSNADVLL